MHSHLDPLMHAVSEARMEWMAEKATGAVQIVSGFVAPLGLKVSEKDGEENAAAMVHGYDKLAGDYRGAHDKASTAMMGMFKAWTNCQDAINRYEQAFQSGTPPEQVSAAEGLRNATNALNDRINQFRTAAEPLVQMNKEFEHAFKENIVFVAETAVAIGTAGAASAAAHKVLHLGKHVVGKVATATGIEAGEMFVEGTAARAVMDFSGGLVFKGGETVAHHKAVQTVVGAAHNSEESHEASQHAAEDAPPIGNSL